MDIENNSIMDRLGYSRATPVNPVIRYAGETAEEIASSIYVASGLKECPENEREIEFSDLAEVFGYDGPDTFTVAISDETWVSLCANFA